MQRFGSNPYSGRITRGGDRQVEGLDGKAGSSSTSRPSPSRQTTKRRKLEPPLEDVSKYFVTEPARRGSLAIPSTSTSFRPSGATANPIIIDTEDDAPVTNDDSHEPIVLRTSSPDPMDAISPNTFISHVFDQNKPSPIHTFSSSLGEKRKSPQDGESTLRVRNTAKELEMHTMEPVFRPNSDDDVVRRLSKILPGLVRSELAAQAEASSERGDVKKKVALFEASKLRRPPCYDLREIVQTRKDGMKPKQVGLSFVMCTTAPATE